MLSGSRPVRTSRRGGTIMGDIAAEWNAGDICCTLTAAPGLPPGGAGALNRVFSHGQVSQFGALSVRRQRPRSEKFAWALTGRNCRPARTYHPKPHRLPASPSGIPGSVVTPVLIGSELLGEVASKCGRFHGPTGDRTWRPRRDSSDLDALAKLRKLLRWRDSRSKSI